MKRKGKVSEELLRTDLMELLGGKGLPTQDNFLLQPVPPAIPPADETIKDDNHKPRVPELINNQVDEVLNKPPAWLVRWGTSMFFGILVLLIGITWFVKYPDLVTSSISLKSVNQPKSVIAKNGGRLEKLFVQDGMQIQENDILAYFESTANHKEVLALEKVINELVLYATDEELTKIHRAEIPIYFSLGELQRSYQVFQEALVRSKTSLVNGTLVQKKSTVAKDIDIYNSINQNALAQLELQSQDLELSKKEWASKQRLQEKGFVSKIEVQNAESTYLNKLQAYEQSKANLENTKMSKNQKFQEILELDKTIDEQRNGLFQAIYTLKSEIEAWKQQYVAFAPTNGKVNFMANLQENQMLKAGEEILYVLPDNSSFYGEMKVGQYNFGKVIQGQEVIVKLQSYPFQEFGTVKGRLEAISEMPTDTTYLLKVAFPDGLVTSSNNELSFRNGMAGTGEIVTEDLRLMEKFVFNVKKSFVR